MSDVATEERRAQLAGKIEKLRRLAASTSEHEARTAGALADKLEAELRSLGTLPRPDLPRPPPQRAGAARAGRPKREPAPRGAKTVVCEVDTEHVVDGDVLTPFTHRYFQLAEFAARWSGVLLHLDRRFYAPYGVFYGPRAGVTKAWGKFSKMRKVFDKKLQVWIDEQDELPTSADCDAYARGFLEGLEQYEASRESAAERVERRSQLVRVDAAYQRGEGR